MIFLESGAKHRRENFCVSSFMGFAPVSLLCRFLIHNDEKFLDESNFRHCGGYFNIFRAETAVDLIRGPRLATYLHCNIHGNFLPRSPRNQNKLFASLRCLKANPVGSQLPNINRVNFPSGHEKKLPNKKEFFQIP